MLTDDRNAQVILALFKEYGIKKIVVSPGTTNVPISRSVQVDPWFEVYSVVDERSAAYFAGGLAYESGEAVVLSCTGATASRNYIPGLTEAYYRNLPVIALTSQHHTSDFGNLVPQVTDRTSSQNDIKKISVHLPVIKDDEDYERCIISSNKALIAATTKGNGPVHINLPVSNFSFTTQELPQVRRINYLDQLQIEIQLKQLAKELHSKKVAVFIGAHRKFDKNSERQLEKFAIKFKAPIFIDHTSSYKGKNSVLIAQLSSIKQSQNKPDLVVDIGSITGEYSVGWLTGIETWRLSEDGQVHDRLHNQTKLFDCPENVFFSTITSIAQGSTAVDYFKQINNEVSEIVTPTLPLSNTLISQLLSRKIPKNSNLHLAILNSLRNMNFFALDKSIDTSSNVGGFGIDGALSTMIGQSMVNQDKLTFGLVGDLAAFYDMNALGIRHIKNNLRILLVNNHGGVEFRLNPTMEDQWAEETNEFISAHGHNGSMRAWAETMGFHYIMASTKEEFLQNIDAFCSSDINKFKNPVLFEVFTEIPDEQSSLRKIQNHDQEKSDDSSPFQVGVKNSVSSNHKNDLKKIMPKSLKKIYRVIQKHD